MSNLPAADPRVSHPPVRLAGSDGRPLDLDDFHTQKLVVFVCPSADRAATAGEIADYEALLPEFDKASAWVVGIAADPGDLAGISRHMRLALDPGDTALHELTRWAGIVADPVAGATFVLERDGGLRAAWSSCGLAREALASVREGP